MSLPRSLSKLLRRSCLLSLFLIYLESVCEAQPDSLYTSGHYLFTASGEKVLLRGVNKMIFYNERDGAQSYSEIAKTGANCVRIFWFTSGTSAELDHTLANAIANKLIPIPSVWEATGKWGKALQQCFDYWSRPDIVAIINKYKRYLILNLANEAGDGSQSQEQYSSVYQAGISQVRKAGIKVPLMIDAAGWGRQEEYLFTNAIALQNADPLHNIIFSWHPWDANPAVDRIESAFDKSVAMKIVLVAAEFAHKSVGCACCINYKQIMSYAKQKEIGWLAWEWGPGNSDCSEMDMTTDNTFATLHGWGLEVAVTDPNSIKNTAVRPAIF